MAHDVFISHSSIDKPTADAIVASLEANGIRCWIAPRDILPGSDWSESVMEAMEQAGTMVLVFSAHSNTSAQIRREIESAVSAGIPVIPFRIEDVLPCKSLQYFIGPQHWLDAWTPPLEQHLHRLTATIKALLSKRVEGFDAAGKEPRLKPQPNSAVTAPIPAATEPPPTPARAETPVEIGPSPPGKFPLIWVVSLVGLLVVLVVAGGIWWRWSQPVFTTPKVPAPAPPTAGPPVTPTPPASAPPVTPLPPVAHQPALPRGKIGVKVQNLTPELAKSLGMAEPKGTLVVSVDPGLPAEKAGIQRSDIIVEFNGHPIQGMKELPPMVAQISPGSKAALKVLRDGKEMTFNLNIAEMTAEDYLKRGNMAKDWQEKILFYNKAIELNLKYAEAYNNRGTAYFDKKYYEMALSDYNNAISINPYFAKPYNNRARYYLLNKQYALALKDFEMAITLNPKEAIFYSNRGLVYTNINDIEAALRDFNKATELDPSFVLAYNYRGDIYFRKKEYSKALQDFNKTIELSPDFAIGYYNRGTIYLEKKEYGKALQEFDKAIELGSKYALPYNNRGNIYFAKKKYDEAFQDYNKAIELDPTYAAAYINRGNTYLVKRIYDKALQDYDKAIELDPNNAIAYSGRGLLYFGKKQYEKALRDYDKAIELNPNFQEVYLYRRMLYKKIR